MTDPFIEVRGITKRFGAVDALRDVSLTVNRGDRLCLIGPNGAGKTTLLKCLAGLLCPISGRVTIGGLDRQDDHLAIRRFTAWVPDQPYISPTQRVAAWLKTVADIYDVPEATRDERVRQLLRAFRLEEHAESRVHVLSNGQHKKLALCQALVTGAGLYLMDEPFTGEIDPPGILVFERLLQEITEQSGATLVFSTQVLAEARRVATHFAVIEGASLLAVGTEAELLGRHQQPSLEALLHSLGGPDPDEASAAFLDTMGPRQ